MTGVERQPAPARIVDGSGAIAFGVFDAPLPEVNLADAHLAWHGVGLPRRWARFRLKEWQHFGLVLPEIFVGLAIVDVGFLRSSWCHVVDRTAGRHFEHKRLGPHLALRLGRELWDDRTYVRTKGYRIEVHNALDRGAHHLEIDLAAQGGKPAVRGSLTCHHDLDRIHPLVVVLPVGENRGMYSHKVALPLSGELVVGDRSHAVDPERSFAILDIHKAHYPHRTWWNWATFAGRDERGRALALNLTRNVNADDARLNENALWVDGQLAHLGPARFEFDPERPEADWRLTTGDGAVDLRFTPRGERSENIRLGLIQSTFRQPYGTFRGAVRFGGETLEVPDLFGVCEDHQARW